MKRMMNKGFFVILLSLICVFTISIPAFAKTADVLNGPGIPKEPLEENSDIITKGTSLGFYKTTGYCNCTKCSGGHNLTYSGTVPMAQHTISADITVLPIGSKVMINNIVYTVEDMGSNVNGNKIDIYYDNHSDAWAHGIKEEEIFAVE